MLEYTKETDIIWQSPLQIYTGILTQYVMNPTTS